MFGVDINCNTVSDVECMDCFKEWSAVHIAGIPELFCPYCNSKNTFRFLPEVPKPLACGNVPASMYS